VKHESRIKKAIKQAQNGVYKTFKYGEEEYVLEFFPNIFFDSKPLWAVRDNRIRNLAFYASEYSYFTDLTVENVKTAIEALQNH
jgi:hypothetical protein